MHADKCQLAQSTVDFLGHQVSAAGIQPPPGRIKAIQEAPLPETVKDLQAFLGSINFYRHFTPAAAQVLTPLTEQLKGGPKGSTSLQWLTPMSAAFQEAKQQLAAARDLGFPAATDQLSGHRCICHTCRCCPAMLGGPSLHLAASRLLFRQAGQHTVEVQHI